MDVIVDNGGTGPAATFDGASVDEPRPQLLSYDETVPYEDQIQSDAPMGSSLADRIGKGKVYLLADAAGPGGADHSLGKRKADDGTEDDAEMMLDDVDLDPSIRPNALLFTGPPIAHLPTQRIFAYATHFDAHPLGLEWVSDTTCVLVFSNRASALKAYNLLQRHAPTHDDPALTADDGTVEAKSIPVPLWPAEKQLGRTLEMALTSSSRASDPAQEKCDLDRKKREEGLAAPLRMRWATKDDVKKRGARKESEFYRKHGNLAGKEIVNGRDIPNLPGAGSRKRRHQDDEEEDEDARRERLDRELDAFLEERSDAEGGGDSNSLADRMGEESVDSRPASPPSKMRSDYIAPDGRTRVDRSRASQVGRWERGERLERGPGGNDRRRGGRGDRSEHSGLSLRDRIGSAAASGDDPWGRSDGGRESKRLRGEGQRQGGRDGRRGGGKTARPHKTQEELDAELDAFLSGPQ